MGMVSQFWYMVIDFPKMRERERSKYIKVVRTLAVEKDDTPFLLEHFDHSCSLLGAARLIAHIILEWQLEGGVAAIGVS